MTKFSRSMRPFTSNFRPTSGRDATVSPSRRSRRDLSFDALESRSLLSVTISFDSLPASGNPVSGATLANYLSGYGITLSAVTAGTAVTVYDARDIYNGIPGGPPLVAPSPFNVIGQTNSSGPISYTLNFALPLEHFAITRTAVLGTHGQGFAYPEWHAFAYDSANNLLGSVGESAFSTFSDIPAAVFTLNGHDIRSVTIASDGHQFAAVGSVILDDFTLSNVAPDLAATSLAWDTSNAQVNYGYTISGADLPQATTAAFYWSTDPTFNTGTHSRIKNSVITTATTAQAAPYTGHIDASAIGTPPTDASYKYLLFVVNPDSTVTESDGPDFSDPNTDNVESIPIQLSDVAMQKAVESSATSVAVDYTINNAAVTNPLQFNVYQTATRPTAGVAYVPGANDTLVGSATLPASDSPDLSTGSHSGVSLSLTSPLTADPTRPYFVVVANPSGPDHFAELDDSNDATFLQLPDISLVGATFEDATTVNLDYSISDSDSPAFNVQAYLSADPTFDLGQDVAVPGRLEINDPAERSSGPDGTPADHSATMTMNLAGLLRKPLLYLILVADPDSAIVEQSKTNDLTIVNLRNNLTPFLFTGNAVQISVSNNSAIGSGTGPNEIDANFSPNGGFSLDDAAWVAGYDHFNWYQIITQDPYPPMDTAGNTPVVPYYDPPNGGYGYGSAGTDSYPYYWDEPLPASVNNKPIVVDPYNIQFWDYPADPQLNRAKNERIDFITYLAGVPADLSSSVKQGFDIYDGFRWYSDYNGADGGVVIRSSAGVLTGGTGGVVLEDMNVDPASLPREVRERMAADGVLNVPQGGNASPMLNTIPDQTVEQGDTLSVHIAASDPDPGQRLTYSLGPNSPVEANVDPNSRVFSWTPTKLGVYSITVIVNDNGSPSLTVTKTFLVTVKDAALIVNLDPSDRLTQGTTFSQTGSFSSTAAGLFTASVNYGDGTGLHPLASASAQTFALSHSYALPGTYTVTVAVTDPFGQVGTQTEQVVVTPYVSGYGPGPDAFVTTLYNQVLGRAPEPAGLLFWSKQLASKVKPRTIATAFWASRERHILQREHKAPPIAFGRALKSAAHAWKQATKVGAVHPTGKATAKP
jgi:hypothetical protein